MKERNKRMAGRMITQKTLFLDEMDYHTFLDFTFLMTDLASNLNDEEIDELQEAIERFAERVNVEMDVETEGE